MPDPRTEFEGAAWTLDRRDALDGLRGLDDACVDLVYMDPPFCTGRARRGRTAVDAFDDRWPSREAYVDFMREHFVEAHRVLRPTGSILVHCDWRTCHRLWLELERIFGVERAVNHLVWSYGLGGSGPRSFARKHDDILFFARGPRPWFEAPRVPSRSRRMAGAPKKATDVIEIAAINNMAFERTGWPSQKPLALLRVLISACCRPDGVVLDPFCGSGTTLVAAIELGRRAIGFDRSPRAIEIATQRLRELEHERARGSPRGRDGESARGAPARMNPQARPVDAGAKRASSSRRRARASSALRATVVTWPSLRPGRGDLP